MENVFAARDPRDVVGDGLRERAELTKEVVEMKQISEVKQVNRALCLVLAAALVATAGTASARTDHAKMLFHTIGLPLPGTGPACASFLPFTIYAEGIDECGGPFTAVWKGCVELPNVFHAVTVDITYLKTGVGSLSMAAADFLVVDLDDPGCLRTAEPGLFVEITGGTGLFDGCTGHATGNMLLSFGCQNPPLPYLELDWLDANIKFPGNGVCPSRR